MPRHHDDDHYDDRRESSSRRGGRVVEYEDVEIRSGRRGEPEFLDEDYGRTHAGPLVVREEEVIEERSSGKSRRRRDRERELVEEEEVVTRPRDRQRRREIVEEDEVIFSGGGRDRDRDRDRPVEREEIREEVVYRHKSRDRERERRQPTREREELVYRRRERSPPMVAMEREEWHFGPRRQPERDESYDRSVSSRSEKDRPRERDYREEEITIRRNEREERPSNRGYERDEIKIREETSKSGERGYEREEIIIRDNVSRERRKPRSEAEGFDREEITIRRDERERPRDRDDELVIIKEETSKSRDKDVVKEEIIIRREEESEPAPEAPPVPYEPETIRAPPIHQEIITHHRHIDHGFEVRLPPASAPPAPRPRSLSPPSPKSSHEEIEIRRRGERNGQRYEDDIKIDTRRKASSDRPPLRERSASAGPRTRTPRFDPVDEEAEYYARITKERAYIGESYHGATKDWAIVDVPPGTNRVKMDGVGGGSQEITWQRYNGVRRSNFLPDGDDGYAVGPAREDKAVEVARKYQGQKPKEDSMWTEITKDLVVKEAIEGCGYDYEETELFYYVMEYLRYEDVLRLVSISDDLRRERRERIRQIEWERQMPEPEPEPPRRMLANKPYEEERIYEREVVYAPPPREKPKEREQEVTYVALPSRPREREVEVIYERPRERAVEVIYEERVPKPRYEERVPKSRKKVIEEKVYLFR